MWRILDHGAISLGDKWGFDVRRYVPEYRWDNNTGTEWWTVGVRQCTKWTPIMKYPAGSRYDSIEISADRRRNNQYKITTAQQWRRATSGRVRLSVFSPREMGMRVGYIQRRR